MLTVHPWSAYPYPNEFQTLLKEKKLHLHSLQRSKTSATVSVISNGVFMYFSRELRKWNSLTKATAVSSPFTGMAVRHFRLNPFWELVRIEIKLVQVASLAMSPDLHILLYFVRVSADTGVSVAA